MRRWLRRAAILLVLLLAWELVRRLELMNALLLASPTEIFDAARTDGMQFLEGFRLTLFEIALAILLSWSIGIGVGLLAGSFPALGGFAGPLLAALFSVPLIVWYPLFMVWVGIGPPSKIVFATISGFFPIALNTMNGVRLLDQKYLRYARSIGTPPFKMVVSVLLPLALPSIISGLRIGTALAVIGVVVTEMLASLDGVGYWISYHRTLFNTGQVYVGILLALTAVVIVNWGLSKLEHHFGRWRQT